MSTFLIWDPNGYPTDSDSRLRTDGTQFAANEANLVVGQAQPPKLKYEEPVFVAQSKSRSWGVRVNQQRQGLQLWLKQQVKPGERLSYYVHVTSNSNEPQTYALLPFLDYRQIPMKPGADELVFVQVQPNQSATFQGSLVAPGSRGVHEFMVVQVYRPLSPIRNDADSFAVPSVRVPVIVE